VTIQEFINLVAQAVAQHVNHSPPKVFQVKRIGDDGKEKQEQTSLPQLIAEQNDHLKALLILQPATNALQVEAIKALRETNELLEEAVTRLRASNAIGKKMLEKSGDAE